MKLKITFKHLEHTPSLDEKIREKSKKLEKYLDSSAVLNWTCFVKDGHHYAEVDVHNLHYDFHATANSDNLYKTLDLVIAKLTKQLSKKKEKVKDKIHKKKNPLVIMDPEAAWADHEDDGIST
ncbi:MAG: ribosome-associated translation inhibitor RaiA [Bacteriovoracaceae bacterium]|nr:ribosome-associated translation inhibitor RaiA [Bacteriovoracaceae bacterium]